MQALDGHCVAAHAASVKWRMKSTKRFEFVLYAIVVVLLVRGLFWGAFYDGLVWENVAQAILFSSIFFVAGYVVARLTRE